MKRLILLSLFCGTFGLTEPGNAAPDLSTMKLVKCSYTLRKGEVTSQAISRLVSSSKNFPISTYGKNGWLAVTERLNGPDFDGNKLKPGESLFILVPETRIKTFSKQLNDCADIYYLVRTAKKPDAKNVGQLVAKAKMAQNLKESDLSDDYVELQPVMTPSRVKKSWYFLLRFKSMVQEVSPIVTAPKEPPFTDVPEVDVPEIDESEVGAPEALEQPVEQPEPITAEELTDEKIAELPPEELEKIEPEVVEEKAWEASIFDSFKPGMGNLFKGLGKTTADGIVALRFGYPLVTEKSLPAKIKTIGLLVELRGDSLKGLRYGYDFSPRARNNNEGVSESFTYSRHTLGWAFEIPVNYIVNQIHIIPKIGTYSVDSKLSTTLTDGTNEGREFRIKNGLALGWEVDLEKAAYFWILRGWIAQDVSGKAFTKRSESVSSIKAGLDASVKGGGFSVFGGRISTTYMAFIARENIKLSGENAESGDFVVSLEVPMAGLGLGLSW